MKIPSISKGKGSDFLFYTMPRIAGIDLPENKQIEIALTYVFGLGRSSSQEILKTANIEPTKKAKDMDEKELGELRKIIDAGYKIEGDLRQEKMRDIRRLKDIKCWRGVRHTKGLPVRGQKTRKNSRTIRGNVRKTVGSGKKAAPTAK